MIPHNPWPILATLRAVGRYAAMPERLTLTTSRGTERGVRLVLRDKVTGEEVACYDNIVTREDLRDAVEGSDVVALLNEDGAEEARRTTAYVNHPGESHTPQS